MLLVHCIYRVFPSHQPLCCSSLKFPYFKILRHCTHLTVHKMIWECYLFLDSFFFVLNIFLIYLLWKLWSHFASFKEIEPNEYGVVFDSLFKDFLVPLTPTRNELATPKYQLQKNLLDSSHFKYFVSSQKIHACLLKRKKKTNKTNKQKMRLFHMNTLIK